jgi:benzil reductase ((S)-benzoin forming)
MSKIFIISGVSRGLGYSMGNHILSSNQDNCFVIGLCRSKTDLSEKFPGRFEWVKADFSKAGEIIPLLDNVLRKYTPVSICFISNAGEINPISKIGTHDLADFNNSLGVNIISPAVLLNHLVSNYSGIGKLLLVNISSGAANKPIKGWSFYSAAKAYMKMYFDVLALELADNPGTVVSVKQIDPGAIDTHMQTMIRNTIVSSDQVDKLKILYESGNLRRPDDVAADIMGQIKALL